MLLLTASRTVVLSVCIDVGGCLFPIISNAWCDGIASWQLMKRALRSASAAEDMKALIGVGST